MTVLPRGVWGHAPPENFWKYGCSEVQFGTFLSRNRIATGLTISCFSCNRDHFHNGLYSTRVCLMPNAGKVPFSTKSTKYSYLSQASSLVPSPTLMCFFAHAHAHFPELRMRLAGSRPLRCRHVAHSYSSIEWLR